MDFFSFHDTISMLRISLMRPGALLKTSVVSSFLSGSQWGVLSLHGNKATAVVARLHKCMTRRIYLIPLIFLKVFHFLLLPALQLVVYIRFGSLAIDFWRRFKSSNNLPSEKRAPLNDHHSPPSSLLQKKSKEVCSDFLYDIPNYS